MRSATNPIGNIGDNIGSGHLRLHCCECQHCGELDPLDLIDRYGNITCWSLIVRAACSRCGARMPELRAAPWTPHSHVPPPRKREKARTPG